MSDEVSIPGDDWLPRLSREQEDHLARARRIAGLVEECVKRHDLSDGDCLFIADVLENIADEIAVARGEAPYTQPAESDGS